PPHGLVLERSRMRARQALPGKAAHRDRRHCGALSARRGQPESTLRPGLRRGGARAMNEAVKNQELRERVDKDYEWGFVSDVEQEFAPKGLSEDTVRFI